MTRWTVGLLALAVATALGLGLYGRFVRTPPPPPVDPVFNIPGPSSALPDLSGLRVLDKIAEGGNIPVAVAVAFVVTDGTVAALPAAAFEHLARTDPVAMYEQCLARYQREVKVGLRATLVKRERVKGDPRPPQDPHEEVIALAVRGDAPDADGKRCVEVLMKWQAGARSSLGSELVGTLYSEKPGKEGTEGKILTWRPKALITTMPVPAADPLAQGQSRYCIRDAGVYRGMLRTYDAWRQRKQAGTLQARYLGKEVVEKAGGRLCHVVERTCPTPEADPFELGGPPVTDPKVIDREGFTRVKVMIDAETWMQVGTELYRPDGHLLASYYFRDIDTNPTFEPDTFTKAGLTRK